jgi:cell division septal protein FtsQ
MDSSAAVHHPAHIDPRIKARRAEVQRDVGRRRIQRLVDVGLVLAVVAGFALAVRSPLLDVDAVTVAGSPHTPAEEVVAAARVGRGDQLMDVDVASVGARVTELPWVEAVEVHRGLDGRMAITVDERTPVAVTAGPDGEVLVDDGGHVLGPVSDDPEAAGALVRLVGTEGVPAVGGRLSSRYDETLALADRLATIAPGLAQELSVDDDLTLVLASGISVRFGGPTLVESKLRSLETVLNQVDLTCAAVIDLRAPGSPVLTREEGCS